MSTDDGPGVWASRAPSLVEGEEVVLWGAREAAVPSLGLPTSRAGVPGGGGEGGPAMLRHQLALHGTWALV